MVDWQPEDTGRLSGGRNLPARVRASVQRHGMFQPGQALLVAVSGGADSTAMLHVLVELSAEMALRLGVAHLDHGLRGEEAAADARFVAALAAEYNLPCYAETVDTGAYASRRRMSVEEAARRLRYRFLLRTARRHGFDRVAVGHHRDDNAESVLIGLIRGSGAAGLGGIAPVRADGVVRPLIDLSRSRIRAYLTARGFAFVSDRTNTDTRLLRNRVRIELMPLLENDFNPNMVAALNRMGAILREEDRWMSTLSRQLLEDTVAFRDKGVVGLSLSRFDRLHLAARRRVLRRALAEVQGNLRHIGLVHVGACLQLADTAASGASLHLPHGIRVQRTERCLEIINPKRLSADRARQWRQPDTLPYRYSMPAPGTVAIPETGESIRLHPMAAEAAPALTAMTPAAVYLDADCLEFPLTLRNMRPGDRFSPLGINGSQKLKKFFCDHKIPRQRRKSCPLLLSRDRIIWVVGLRIDNSVKLTAATTRVLKAELILA